MSTEIRKPSPELPSLTGRALQLYWSAAAEFEKAGNPAERDNVEYVSVLAELLTELERDVKRGDQQLIIDGVRVVLGAARHADLHVNATFRLLAEIGLDLAAMERIEAAVIAAR